VKLAPYPRYKPSGVEWLGEVPENWVIVPLKHRCTRSALYGANIPAEDYAPVGVRFLRTTDIDEFGELQPGGVFIDPLQAEGYELCDGDILLSRSGTIGRAFVYSSTCHPKSAYAGYLVRFVPSERLNPTFAFYFTKSAAFNDWLDTQVIASTIGNVNGQKYAQCLLPLPDRPEQDAIADFLDRETAKIDTLVARKRTLIERLKEKRTALISRTVTRGLPPDAATQAGLDPHPNLKPSGIDWLGDVPQHWEIGNLRRFALMRTGHTPARTEPE
jgi:type I restriction enzyme S subunit